MVPRCSTTSRGEYKRMMPSNRGLANHVAVSPISDSNDLMTGSCRSNSATLLAISIPRFCVIQVPSRPDASIYWPVRCLACTPVLVIEADIRQIDVPPCLERSGDPDLSPSDPALGTPGRGEGPRPTPAAAPEQAIPAGPLGRLGHTERHRRCGATARQPRRTLAHRADHRGDRRPGVTA